MGASHARVVGQELHVRFGDTTRAIRLVVPSGTTADSKDP